MSSKSQVQVIVSSRNKRQVDQKRVAKRHGSLSFVSSFLDNSNSRKNVEDKNIRLQHAKG